MFEKKEISKKFYPALPTEVLALESYFEEMSELGYLVAGTSNLYYEFEKCEPQKRRFHVEYFIKASIFDSRPEKQTEEFIDYCEVAGWEYCFSNGKMQCFYTEDMSSPDIETDDGLRFQSIFKAVLLTQMPTWLVSLLYLLLGVPQLIATMNRFYLYSRFLTSPIEMGLFMFFLIFIIFSFAGFIDVMSFYLKNRKRLSLGEPLALYTAREAKRRMNGRMIFMTLLLVGIVFVSFSEFRMAYVMIVFLVAVVLLMVFQGKFMKTKVSNRQTNILMTIILTIGLVQLFFMISVGTLFVGKNIVFGKNSITFVEQEKVPVSLDELGYFPDDEYNYRESYFEQKESIFAKETSFSDYYVSENGWMLNKETEEVYPFIQVDVFESEHTKVISKYLDLYIEDRRQYGLEQIEFMCLDDYGYEGYMSYVNGNYNIILMKEKKAVHIKSHVMLTEQNVDLILSEL